LEKISKSSDDFVQDYYTKTISKIENLFVASAMDRELQKGRKKTL